MDKRIVYGIAIFLFIVLVTPWILQKQQSPSLPKYTAEQKKLAQEYHDLMMNGGLITELKGEGKLQIIYVNRNFWSLMTYENKKKFLKGMSMTNEILGYTPWMEIKDNLTGELYGALKPPLTNEIYK